MADEIPPLPKKGIGDMTLKDLLGVIGTSGGYAGYAALAMVLLSYVGCEGKTLPNVRPPFFSPPRKTDVPNAICKISMGNVGCTATIIGPVQETDPQITLLTAAHCIKVGVSGKAVLKDGRSFTFKCVSRDANADCAWLVADRPPGDVPYALLATTLPEKGSPVWHQGYGIDKPGNVEAGTFQGTTSDGRQCVFNLSVSSGDSGGGIVLTSDGAILSPVCCTTRLSGPGNVMGSTPMNAAAIRPGRVATVGTEELYRPIIILPDARWEEPPTS